MFKLIVIDRDNIEDSEIIKKLEIHLMAFLLVYGIKDQPNVRSRAIDIYKNVVKPSIQEEWERAVMLFYPSDKSPS